MLIATQTLEHGPKLFDLVIPGSEIDLQSEGAELKADVTIRGEAKAVGGRFEVNGKLTSQVRVDCSRCLEPVDVPLKVKFDDKFVEPNAFNAADEHELDAEALMVDVLEGESIDLHAIAREQVLLNVPEQVLCQESCRGLCEKCGANRSLIDCDCTDDEIDPRWAALKNLN